MTATSPGQVHALWSKAFSAFDMPALLALYEPEAVLTPAPDEVFQGHDAIRQALEGFFALRPFFQMTLVQVVQAGDLAILYSNWSLAGTDPEGKEVRMTGVTSDVVRRQADGRWLMVIDSPFGGCYPICIPTAS